MNILNTAERAKKTSKKISKNYGTTFYEKIKIFFTFYNLSVLCGAIILLMICSTYGDDPRK